MNLIANDLQACFLKDEALDAFYNVRFSRCLLIRVTEPVEAFAALKRRIAWVDSDRCEDKHVSQQVHIARERLKRYAQFIRHLLHAQTIIHRLAPSVLSEQRGCASSSQARCPKPM